MLFNEHQKLTIITVSEMLQTTLKREIKLTRVIDGRQAYTVRGKNKEYILDITPDMLVFDGWGVPLTVDSDTGSFVANGGYNFVTEKAYMIKKFIEVGNLNEKFAKEHLIMYRPQNGGYHDYRFLFGIEA